MKKTRQPIPDGLADIPPGPELAAVLAEIDLSRLGGFDCVTVIRAQHRQVAHEQARLMTAMVEVALCGIGPDDALPRMDAPDEFSADEIRGALVWTRAAANAQLSLAWDLVNRLPQVFAALDAGSIDVPKTKVFSEWTAGLTQPQADQVCDLLLPEAPALTTGQLAERIKKMAIAVDPDWARRRYEDAVRERKVVGYRNEDGSANLCGYQLPADRAAAASTHIDTVAKKIKRSGDGRPIGHIRADLYLAMLDGSYTGWSEQDIIADMLAMARHATAEGEAGDHTLVPGSDDHAEHSRASQPLHPVPQGASDAVPPGRRAGVEVRVEVATLLGLDDHPAELPGSGPIHAQMARRLVREQTAAEWRYAITDDEGRLLYEGITRRRPHGFPPRAKAPAHGGIVELQIRLSTLRWLTARPVRLGGWADLIADLARQTHHHQQANTCDQPEQHGADETGQPQDGSDTPDPRGPRSPGKPMRRHTEIRDRTCTNPRCRTPARATDGDHIEEWARGGATHKGNIGSACRHDHRLRHEGGWRVIKLASGQLVWISRLGVHYRAQPPLIIQPLPDPVPRDPPPPYRHDDHEGEPIWREPARAPVQPGRSPPRPGPAEPPPF